MIKKWLTRHRWVNELGKTIIVVFFGSFSFAVWEAGKLASVDIAMAESYKLMLFGIVIGILGMLALFILVDVVASIPEVIRRLKERAP